MAQEATKNLHLRHQETWSVPTSSTKCPSAGTGQAKQSCRTTKYHLAGTERIFDFTPVISKLCYGLSDVVPIRHNSA